MFRSKKNNSGNARFDSHDKLSRIRNYKVLGRNRVRLAIIITLVVMVVEVVGGLLSNSLALLSDAGHMLTHVFALGMSYFAIVFASKPATKEKTFGYYRTEVLVAFINGIVLLLVVVWIAYEAVGRLFFPEVVMGKEMLLVAFVGLVANGASVLLLGKVGKHDLNLRSAFLHVLGDTISSVAVVGGAIILLFTDNFRIDAIVSIFICGLVVVWAVKLLTESINILLESAPKGLDIDEVSRTIIDSVPEVKEVHDLHVWVLTSHMYSMTAHVLIEDCKVSKSKEIIDSINKLVEKKFKIRHAIIQFETKHS